MGDQEEHFEFMEHKRIFREFLAMQARDESSPYSQQLYSLGKLKSRRLLVDINDLDKFETGLAEKVMGNPSAYLPAFDEGLLETIAANDPDFSKKAHARFPRVGFSGIFGSRLITPRGLKAEMVGELLCVEGIVTRCSVRHPRIHMSVHYCPGSEAVRVKEHRDQTALKTPLIEGGAMPKFDENNNPFEQEWGLSLYRDFQSVTLQEMPEVAPTSQMPRGAELLLTEDLADSLKPGDRVRVYGVYKQLARQTQGGVVNGVFRSVVIANAVAPLNAQIRAPSISPSDQERIKAYAKSESTFDILGKSFAPSISGRELEKKGLLLMMLGGDEKILSDGSHLRGDIHVLMLGDPSCGKSQLLRFVMKLAPLSISTTGRGSSGVGLTAAVGVDKETGEKHLEAGAMVLGDRGVVCIDEFDKMSPGDRSAIHEVMEQQTVTIAKAGMHTTLNARCSLLAAANPIYGNFDPSLDLHQNINLPDSLLSRFDLIFIVRDLMSFEEDRKIASKVLLQCQLRPGEGRGDNKGDASIPEGHNEQVFSRGLVNVRGGSLENVPVEFLRKYIHFCKLQPTPQMSEQASEAITQLYVELRGEFKKTLGGEGDSQSPLSGLAVTVRTLEALIRLSTAHAKLKLRTHVMPDDVAAIKGLFRASRNLPEPSSAILEPEKAISPEPRRRKVGGKEQEKEMGSPTRRRSTRKTREEAPRSASRKRPSSSNLDEFMEESVAGTPKKRARTPVKAKRGAKEKVNPLQALPSEESAVENVNEMISELEVLHPAPSLAPPSLPDPRLGELKQVVMAAFEGKGDSMPIRELEDLMSEVCAPLAVSPFTKEELQIGFRMLSDENKILLTEDHVFLL